MDATANSMGRNARALLKAAEKTGVRIVIGCGYSYARTHPPYLVRAHEHILRVHT